MLQLIALHKKIFLKSKGGDKAVQICLSCTESGTLTMHMTCDRYGEDYWMEDIDAYDLKCKVEPLQRALKEYNSDAWINGRRRDHGAERAGTFIE